MRFRKGSKVEVLKRTEVPSGCWYCAEIISRNGHNYNIRYQNFPDVVTVERLSRNAIRPLPPPSGGAENWVPSDIVEVFDNNSWKIAEVSKVMGGHYFVRLLGSAQQFRVHKLNLRVRQSWQDNQWVVIGKSNCRLSGMNMKATITQHVLEQDAGFQADKVRNMALSVRSVKRSREVFSSHLGENAGPDQKLRAIKKDGRLQQSVTGCQSHLLEKVDAVASPQIVLGEKYMHASFNNRTTHFSEIDTEESRNFNAEVGCFFPRSLEPIDDAEASTCSIASCSSSTRDNPYKLSCLYITGPNQASGSGGWVDQRESSPSENDELAAEIHKLELHAYRSTMEALYASGPLSWEQEEMMTNLRLSLNISNDEHLLELRHLVSAEC
ncbi:uncharacterized protein [Aristolochia californica]|uniref:uncharacterized protein isoform X2 n=1 Tax=Aristolochia californica TaxID=171875 RepID=UPI0035DBBC01